MLTQAAVPEQQLWLFATPFQGQWNTVLAPGFVHMALHFWHFMTSDNTFMKEGKISMAFPVMWHWSGVPLSPALQMQI